MTRSRAVIFVDAHISEEREDVELSQLDLVEGAAFVVTHISLPEELMAITKAVYDRTPPAFVCAVRGYDFSFGAPLTRSHVRTGRGRGGRDCSTRCIALRGRLQGKYLSILLAYAKMQAARYRRHRALL